MIILNWVKNLEYEVLSLIEIGLCGSFEAIEMHLIHVLVLHHSRIKVINRHLRMRIIRIRLIHLGDHILFYILEYLILRSLIEAIHKRVLGHIHWLVLVVHHVRILILVNILRFLYHLLHWHLWNKTCILFWLRLMIIFLDLIRFLGLTWWYIISIWFSIGSIVTVVVLSSWFFRNLRGCPVLLCRILTSLTYLWR